MKSHAASQSSQHDSLPSQQPQLGCYQVPATGKVATESLMKTMLVKPSNVLGLEKDTVQSLPVKMSGKGLLLAGHRNLFGLKAF